MSLNLKLKGLFNGKKVAETAIEEAGETGRYFGKVRIVKLIGNYAIALALIIALIIAMSKSPADVRDILQTIKELL